MHRDPLVSLQGVRERLNKVQSRIRLRESELVQAERERERLASEVEGLREKALHLQYTADLFRHWFDQMVQKDTAFVAQTVTSGLQSVFYDQQLALETEFQVRAGRVNVDLALSRREEDGSLITGDPRRSFGGGPVSLTSLLLRIVVLLRSSRARFLLLDETVAAVSDDYVDACGMFLRSLAEKLGVDLVLVIHKPAYLEHAHHGYQGSEVAVDGRTELRIQPMRRSQ